jgi:hypothetical protein
MVVRGATVRLDRRGRKHARVECIVRERPLVTWGSPGDSTVDDEDAQAADQSTEQPVGRDRVARSPFADDGVESPLMKSLQERLGVTGGTTHAQSSQNLSRVSSPLSAIELLGVLLLLCVVAAAVFVPYVLRGGFYSDDWSNAALYGPLTLAEGIADTADNLGARPLLAVLLPVPHELFGVAPAEHLGFGLALGVLTCLAFFAVLRELRIPTLPAAAMAALALVFPWSDSVRLWATASLNTVTVLLALIGMYAGLRSASMTGRRGVVVHGVAVVFFVLSVLMYEAAAGVMLLVGALYLGRTSRSRALWLWGVDVVAIGIALVYTAATIDKNVGGVADRFTDMPRFVEQAISVFSLSLVPPDTTDRAVRALAVGAAAVVVAFALQRYVTTKDVALGYWLRIAGGAVVAIAASYAVLLGTYLEPVDPGEGNRANLVAGYGYAVLVVALAMVAAHAFGRRGKTVAIVAGCAVALLGANYVAGTVLDERRWERADRLQQPVLRAVERATPELPEGATVLTFGHPALAAPGVPVFFVNWDLDGAVQLRLHDPTIHAYPVHDHVRVTCEREALRLAYVDLDEHVRIAYGPVLFLDVPTGKTMRIPSRSVCNQALTTFRPGPFNA